MDHYVVIRNMSEEDLEQVCKIENETFTSPWSYHSYEQVINNENNLFLVAENKGVIVGYCGYMGVLDEGQITNVAVKKEYRGKNIGYRLMESLLHGGIERGIRAFTLEVRVSNEKALNLYERLGFIREGIRKNYYMSPKEDAVIMWNYMKNIPL